MALPPDALDWLRQLVQDERCATSFEKWTSYWKSRATKNAIEALRSRNIEKAYSAQAEVDVYEHLERDFARERDAARDRRDAGER